MISDSKTRLLKSTAYHYGANFANFPVFFRTILKLNIESELQAKDYLRLNRLSETLLNKYPYLETFNQRGYLQTYETIIDSLSEEFGFQKWPVLNIVENLPCIGLGNKAWDATVIDRQESKRLDLDVGVYFNRASLTHCYFEFVVCHELMHWIISEYSIINPAYVSLWEEGLCDFFSAFVLFKYNILPKQVVYNLVLYNRHFKKNDSVWKRYHVYLNSVINLSLQHGID